MAVEMLQLFHGQFKVNSISLTDCKPFTSPKPGLFLKNFFSPPLHLLNSHLLLLV